MLKIQYISQVEGTAVSQNLAALANFFWQLNSARVVIVEDVPCRK